MATERAQLAKLTRPRLHHAVARERLFGLLDETGIPRELHVNQIKRYEVGTTLPSLEAIKKIATTFHVSVDALLFDEGERGPDEELRLQFEAVAQFDAEEKQAVRSLIEGMILKHQARQLLQLARPASPAPAAVKSRRGRPAQRAARS